MIMVIDIDASTVVDVVALRRDVRDAYPDAKVRIWHWRRSHNSVVDVVGDDSGSVEMHVRSLVERQRGW